MKRLSLKNIMVLVSVIVAITLFSSHGFAEWVTNDDFPLIGDPNAKKGGTLRYGINSYPATFRIHGPNSHTVSNTMMSGLVYQTLIEVHPITLDIIPSLAEAWEIKEDKKTFLFRLNSKARWADGKPVTPEDVVFSWELTTDPKTQDPQLADIYNRFERPEIVDKYTVKFVAKSLHWRNFLFCGGLEILPAHTFQGKDYLKEFNWKLPNGSGPYKIEKFRKGQNIILKRRDDFWAKDERAYKGLYNFDQIKFIVVRDRNLEFEKFKKGEFDFYIVNIARQWVNDTNFDKVQKGWIQKRKVFTFEPNGVYGLAMNMRRPPFDDLRVRKALAYLYNRQLFMEKLFFNEYFYMDSYYPGSIYENPNNEKIEYDPEKARKLLAEAGWKDRNEQGVLVKDGKSFTVTLMYFSKGSERHLTIFQEDLKKVGIELNLKFLDPSTMFKLIDERNYDMASMGWNSLLFPNPEPSYHSKYADIEQTNNITGIKNSRIDEIIEAYPEMFDVNDRVKALQELDGLVYNEHPYVLNWYAPHYRALYWNKFGMPDYYFIKFTELGAYNSILWHWWYDEEKDKALKEAMENDTALPVGETIVDYWRVQQ
jgi:microcin C transport system substrate-binding protein